MHDAAACHAVRCNPALHNSITEQAHTQEQELLCREEMQALYVYLDGLACFIDLNCEGFRKALKKHDKVLQGLGQALLKDNYMPIVALKCCQRNRPLVEVGPLPMRAVTELCCPTSLAASGHCWFSFIIIIISSSPPPPPPPPSSISLSSSSSSCS